jgi:hypothetical protein
MLQPSIVNLDPCRLWYVESLVCNKLTDSPMHECKLPTLPACNKLTDSPTHQCNVSAVTMTVSIVASGSVRHTMLGLF